MTGRIGLSVIGRSGPKRVADTPQLQALLEDLTDPSTTISEGDWNIEEDTVAANVQCSGQLERGISSAVLDEEAQLSPIVSARSPHRPTQTARCAVDSMVARTGLLVLHRSDPRRLVDAPQLQALLEDLIDPLATTCCGGSATPQDRFRLTRTDTGDTMKELQNARHHNHIYKNTFNNAHI